MEITVLSENELLDNYVTELTSKLSPNARLELIARLSQTLKSVLPEATAPVPEVRKTLLDFAGLWANDPDARTMEESISGGRKFDAKPYLENWD